VFVFLRTRKEAQPETRNPKLETWPSVH
jgi:hypothetical protein